MSRCPGLSGILDAGQSVAESIGSFRADVVSQTAADSK
jgi:hypothetical protein